MNLHNLASGITKEKMYTHVVLAVLLNDVCILLLDNFAFFASFLTVVLPLASLHNCVSVLSAFRFRGGNYLDRILPYL